MSRRANISRSTALAAVPVQVPHARTEEKNGKLYVTVKYRRPGWQRLLGADEECDRTYGLDQYGREVYTGCNGKAAVSTIVKRFAKQHALSRPEAEKAVTTFLKTLMARGLIGMELPNAE